jgi:hypothetical protein
MSVISKKKERCSQYHTTVSIIKLKSPVDVEFVCLGALSIVYCHQIPSERIPSLTISLLMYNIYGAPCKARNFNVVYIYIYIHTYIFTYVWQR